jgi:carboxypeptidase T
LGGYDIKVLKLTNSAITGSKPKLFVNSAIHAREYTTAALNLEFARWLVNGYGVNADATWILDHHEVHLMLQTNPDGRKKAETGLSWRKNTNQAYCGATSNTRGADLNRNFSFSFNSTGGQGSSGNQCDLTYRGPSAASEPETQAIEAYVRSLWPDQRGPNLTDAAPRTNSGIHIDVHSYSQLVLWPWGTTSAASGNATDLQTLGRKLAFFNGYTPQQAIGLYPTDGTSDSVSYGELGVAAYTIELGTSFFQSCTTYNSTIKPQNLNALIYAAKVVRTPYITPAGPDVSVLALSGTASTTGVQVGTAVNLTGTATDTRYNNSNGVQATQNIAAAEYYIDTPPWVSGATPTALVATDGAFNAKTEGIRGTINTSSLSVGKHIVYVRSRDAGNNWGPFTAAFLQVNP